jgi:hypothetical protein
VQLSDDNQLLWQWMGSTNTLHVTLFVSSIEQRGPQLLGRPRQRWCSTGGIRKDDNRWTPLCDTPWLLGSQFHGEI